MIIGYGDIAKILTDRDGAILFASGVSNSSCIDVSQFDRERNLLMSQPKDKCIFYFGTISIFYQKPWTAYCEHKERMETLIAQNWANYNIIRIGNIDWGTNPNTFLNFLRSKKDRGLPFEVFDEFRFTISKKDLLFYVDNLPLVGGNEVNVFSKMAKVKDLI